MTSVLEDAMRWVATAHDATGRQGISAGYDLTGGWQPTYPETSGYLVPTMLRAAGELDGPFADELRARAVQVGQWLLELQAADGSFPGGTGTEGPPVVFDVGQIMLGLLALWRATGAEAYRTAADRAGHWLGGVQRDDGAWLSHFGYPNTYSSRVTWALAETWQATGDQAHLERVNRSLRWLAGQAQPGGWIGGMSFSAGHTAWTHTIGYALRGLLRAGDIAGGPDGQRCVAAAAECAGRLARLRTPLYPLLPGELGPDFVPLADYACLTGDAQLVTIWADLADRGDEPWLRERAAATLERLSRLQVRQPLEPAAVGALAGSWPLSGAFEPNAFPNWATKFLADAAMNLRSARPVGAGPAGRAPGAITA
ncbi:prenyltransferase/squalene oxidase repeat-containing protein [Dactylosporangium sp. CA-139114]|uniref:prenyltransferase/squalene oxidase repeat-containing protein n=1 Tax=Dactylosporangium sp. CA-139114 TaxID=3239931 RepID=UPI003D99DF7F